MYINSIQPQLFSQQNYSRKVSLRQEKPVERSGEQTSFKGGKGLVGGFLAGVFGTAALAIATGGFAIPAIISTYISMGVGAGAGYAASEIEDAITGKDEK